MVVAATEEVTTMGKGTIPSKGTIRGTDEAGAMVEGSVMEEAQEAHQVEVVAEDRQDQEAHQVEAAAEDRQDVCREDPIHHHALEKMVITCVQRP